MIVRFVTWFYKEIPPRILRYFKVWLLHLADIFSVGILLRTFLAPWKRDIISTKNLPLKQRFEIWTMNIVSRLIGAFIKTCTLAAFLISFVGWLASFILFFFGWLLFPVIFLSIIFNYPDWSNFIPYV